MCSAEATGFNKILVKFDSSCKRAREVLFKPNQTRKEQKEKPKGRTLLVVNVPSYCDRADLRKIFQKFGEVDSISVESKLGRDSMDHKRCSLIEDYSQDDLQYFPVERLAGFHYAFIVYQEASSVSVAMKQKVKDTPILLSAEDNKARTGMAKWVKSYIHQYPNKQKLQANVDAFMTQYDAAAQRAEEEEENAAEEDEDGWVKVTRKGKNPVIPRTEANQLRARAKEKMRRKRKELLHSYSYQIRESKRQKIASLRQKFEEDKKRIEEMKEARKFRPF